MRSGQERDPYMRGTVTKRTIAYMCIVGRSPDHFDISLPSGQLTLRTFDRLRLHPSAEHAPTALHWTNVVSLSNYRYPLDISPSPFPRVLQE